MARLPRLVLPGLRYYVTQRGNRRAQTFFEDGDYELYRDLLGEASERAGVASSYLCGCAPALYRLHQRAEPLDRSFVAGSLRCRGHG
jgi:REP element-mobilizing transposase RayT